MVQQFTKLNTLHLMKKPSLNPAKAPTGFIAVAKSDIKSPNVCTECDARKLCTDNKKNWCLNNPCMTLRRIDGVGVVFKRIQNK